MTAVAAPAAPSSNAAPAGEAPAASEAPGTPSAGHSAPGGSAGSAPARDNGGVKGLVPPAPGAEKPKPAAPEKRKYKLKVDGQEHEAEYTDDQIATELQMAKAARKRMQQAAEIQKQWTEVQKLFKENPAEAFKLMGADFDATAEARIADKYRREVMSETERAQLQQQEELETYKKKVADFERQQREAYEAQEMSRLEQQTEAELKQAFELGGFDWNADNLEAVAKVVQDALEYGVELTPQQAVAQVRAQFEDRDRSFSEKTMTKLKGLKGGELLSAMGDDLVRAVLQASLEKHQAAQPNPATAAPSVPTPGENPFKKTKDNAPVQNPRDFWKSLRKL